MSFFLVVLRQGSQLGQRERFSGVRRSVLFFTMFRNTSVCVCVGGWKISTLCNYIVVFLPLPPLSPHTSLPSLLSSLPLSPTLPPLPSSSVVILTPQSKMPILFLAESNNWNSSLTTRSFFSNLYLHKSRQRGGRAGKRRRQERR